MKNIQRNFNIELQVDRKANDDHAFCNIILNIGKHCIGNPDAWAVAGLAAASIADMVSRLQCQTLLQEESLAFLENVGPEELFRCFYEWQWGDGSFCYQHESALSSVKPEFFPLCQSEQKFLMANVFLLSVSPRT